MNRLRKIARWLWLNKERMVLAIMFCFLLGRVYRVVQPEPEEGGGVVRAPRAQDQLTPEAQAEAPGLPPPPPGRDEPVIWDSLHTRNPFVYTPPGSQGPQEEQDELANVKLLLVQTNPDGSTMARIQTAPGVRAWYREGESFESFELLSIDADSDPPCVELYAENVGRTVTKCLEE